MSGKRIEDKGQKESLVLKCRATLDAYWAEITKRADEDNTADFINSPELIEAIRYSLNCSTKAYHYILLTQLVAKVADPRLDSRALQKRAKVLGAFDARTIAKKVVHEFEKKDLDRMLGNSAAPYVNNVLRIPLLTPEAGEDKRDRAGWDRLCKVVSLVEQSQPATGIQPDQSGAAETSLKPEAKKRTGSEPTEAEVVQRSDERSATELAAENVTLPNDFIKNVFRQVLLEVYRKLGASKITYPRPIRVSLEQAIGVITNFIEPKSGGDRPLAVTAALFKLVGQRFGLFQNVSRERINASDDSTGQIADIECKDADGNVVIVAEVKDRTVTVSDLEEKLATTRDSGIKEVFFISGKGKKQTNDVPARVEKEFSAGQNIYVFNVNELARAILALAGESARRKFLTYVGEQLDTYSDTKHRLAWKKALHEIVPK